MPLRRLAILALFGALLSDCGTSAILKNDAEGPGPDESVLVVGIKTRPNGPELYGMHFIEATYSGETVDFGRETAFPVISGKGRDGYLVAKAKAGQVLVLARIFATTKMGKLESYLAYCRVRVMVAEVPKGQVVYLGDIELAEGDRQLLVRYGDDLVSAQKHMRTNYPRLNKLEPLATKFMRTKC